VSIALISISVVDPNLDFQLTADFDIKINTKSEYLNVYDQIASAIHTGENLTVLVYIKSVARWLKIMANRYGPDIIEFCEITPRSMFLDQVYISELPDWVKDQEILESELLDLFIPSKQGEIFENYILRVFFGDWLVQGEKIHNVANFCSNYELDQWGDALRRPVVARIYKKRLSELREANRKNSDKADLQLFKWLEISPSILKAKLFALRVLQKYPKDLGIRVVGEQFTALLALPIELNKIPVTLTDNEDLIFELSAYFREVLINKNAGNNLVLIDEVSGCLEIEFSTIYDLLTSGSVEVNDEMVHKIKKLFGDQADSPIVSQGLDDIDLLISRDTPSLPDENWNEENWIRWAADEYLPYRYWLENSGRITDNVGDLASKFSDWYFNKYGHLLFHSDRMVWKSLLLIQDQLKQHAGPVLIVIVDNFNSKFYPFFKRKLQQQGFYERNMDLRLASIPTCTEVSKRSLLSAHHAPFKSTNYATEVEKIWSKRTNKKIKYFGSMDDMRAEKERTADIYFLNYLALDISLHGNSNQLGTSHVQLGRTFLTILARDIKSFANRVQAQDDLLVVITSDHGSTNIPKGTINVIQKAYYKERAKDEHHRYISITEDELEKLPDNIQFDCYLINKDNYDLANHYLVARKLYRFLPTSDHTYIHGGITPEEVLVPFAIFRPATFVPKKFELRITKPRKIFIGTKFELDLEITNKNNQLCENVEFQLNAQDIEAEAIHINQLNPLTRINVSTSARCLMSARPQSGKLNFKITFRIQGQEFEHTSEPQVEISEPAKTKFDLDNL